MAPIVVRPLSRRRGGKEEFLVHFFAYNDFDLHGLLTTLQKKRAFKITLDAERGSATIKITATKRQLRKLLEKVPNTVQFGYEATKEPEKC